MKKTLLSLVLVFGLFFNFGKRSWIVGVRPSEVRPWLIAYGVAAMYIGYKDKDTLSGKVLGLFGLGLTVTWTF